MIAGKFEYQWKHHARSKKPRSYPAQYYLLMMFQWINEQKHIFEMEQMRHKRMVKELTSFNVIHTVFKDQATCTIVADYLHDPFYYLSGIWAKAFSVFAHVFCQHFGPEELAPEVKQFMEAAFERFMGFVKGYRILSSRRLAPLEDRIAKLDIKMPSRPATIGNNEPHSGAAATFIDIASSNKRASMPSGKPDGKGEGPSRLMSLSENPDDADKGDDDMDADEGSEVGVAKDIKKENSEVSPGGEGDGEGGEGEGSRAEGVEGEKSPNGEPDQPGNPQ